MRRDKRIRQLALEKNPHYAWAKMHMHFTDAWPRASTPFESYVLSQGVRMLFWGTQIFRNGTLYDMNASPPLESDIIIGPDAR